MATNHTGRMVLCRYPTPNGLYEPFGRYEMSGFSQWKKLNSAINKHIEIGAL
jgi:hypothetical protein